MDMMELNKVLLADNMDVMRSLPDKCFELALIDPEYGLGEDGKKSHSRKGLAAPKLYTPKQWDSAPPTAAFFKELFRVSKNQIIWGWNHFAHLLPASAGMIVWDKKCHDKYSTDMSDGEIAWSSIGGSLKIYRFLWSGMMQGNPADGTTFIGDLSKKQERFHPTEKPYSLYRWLLKNYAKPGDRILDTHAGSCSSVIACLEMGYEYLAIEKDPDYHAAATKRIAQYQSQYKLFAS